MAAATAQDFSAPGLLASDAALKSAPVAEKYLKVADAAALGRAAEALKKNGWEVIVVPTKAEALVALQKFTDAEGSYFAGGSLSLEQVGWTAWLKDHPEAYKRNYKGEAATAEGKGDHAAAAALRAEGSTADWYFSSVVAVTEAGDVHVVDLSGTRVSGFLNAKNVVVLASAQKIVPTLEDAVDRARNAALPLESARARIVYGVPGSAIANSVTLSAYNPWAAPGKRHIVLVSDEALGY